MALDLEQRERPSGVVFDMDGTLLDTEGPASEASLHKGMILLGFYALGLGVPFIVVAAFLSKMGNTLNFFKRNFEIIERIMGLLLWTVGLLMLSGGFTDLSFWLLETFPVLGTLG